MRNKRSAVSKNSQIEGGGKRICSEGCSENHCCNSVGVSGNSINGDDELSGTHGENELPTAKSSLLNPLSSNHIQSVLTDITNTPSSSNCMQRDDSCLTYSSTLNVTHTIRPESQSVNQKKRGKTHLPQIRELATDLCKSLDIPLHERKIIVPLLKRPPKELEQLFFNKDSSHAKKFLRNIRLYNNMFSFTSMGGRIDHSINSKGGRPYSFVLSGQNHHLIGSLLPPQGNPPVYAQLYIYDTENEVSNRISTVSHVGGGHLDQSIVEMLKECLDKHNCVVKHYRNAAEIIKQNVISDVSIRLIRSSNVTGQSKQYNMPTTSELAALIVGDFDNSYTKRDIIVKRQSGSLQRIDELHMAYLPLQYPLFFPYGDNRYDLSNEHAQESLSTIKKKKKLTPREYMTFRLMRRKSERSVILHGKKLLQQFIVDGYSMVESDRLDYIRKHQKDLRVDLYSGLTDAITGGETDLSSTGMTSYFIVFFHRWRTIHDSKLSRCYGHLCLGWLSDIFRPSHATQCGLRLLVIDEKILGSIKADVYTVEFQKRGFHMHISYYGMYLHVRRRGEYLVSKYTIDIHPWRDSVFIRLNKQSIYYTQGETMSSLVNNPRVKESMFLAWFEKNKDDPFARTLTYSQFPNHFTFVREKRFWKIRERGFSVGRIGHCTPAQGELYYLRLLLTKVRGAKTYTDIRTVNTVVYPTFREACYALGLLDDDKEYIDAIKEASSWASTIIYVSFHKHVVKPLFISTRYCLGTYKRIFM
ncbi:hypothetical protein K1719_030940 [Acacia pycnantha]|nr:hypothetical protein K1719_030940 [Acacia pycnantha]